MAEIQNTFTETLIEDIPSYDTIDLNTTAMATISNGEGYEPLLPNMVCPYTGLCIKAEFKTTVTFDIVGPTGIVSKTLSIGDIVSIATWDGGSFKIYRGKVEMFVNRRIPSQTPRTLNFNNSQIPVALKVGLPNIQVIIDSSKAFESSKNAVQFNQIIAIEAYDYVYDMSIYEDDIKKIYTEWTTEISTNEKNKTEYSTIIPSGNIVPKSYHAPISNEGESSADLYAMGITFIEPVFFQFNTAVPRIFSIGDYIIAYLHKNLKAVDGRHQLLLTTESIDGTSYAIPRYSSLGTKCYTTQLEYKISPIGVSQYMLINGDIEIIDLIATQTVIFVDSNAITDTPIVQGSVIRNCIKHNGVVYALFRIGWVKLDDCLTYFNEQSQSIAASHIYCTMSKLSVNCLNSDTLIPEPDSIIVIPWSFVVVSYTLASEQDENSARIIRYVDCSVEIPQDDLVQVL